MRLSASRKPARFFRALRKREKVVVGPLRRGAEYAAEFGGKVIPAAGRFCYLIEFSIFPPPEGAGMAVDRAELVVVSQSDAECAIAAHGKAANRPRGAGRTGLECPFDKCWQLLADVPCIGCPLVVVGVKAPVTIRHDDDERQGGGMHLEAGPPQPHRAVIREPVQQVERWKRGRAGVRIQDLCGGGFSEDSAGPVGSE